MCIATPPKTNEASLVICSTNYHHSILYRGGHVGLETQTVGTHNNRAATVMVFMMPKYGHTAPFINNTSISLPAVIRPGPKQAPPSPHKRTAPQRTPPQPTKGSGYKAFQHSNRTANNTFLAKCCPPSLQSAHTASCSETYRT